MVKIYRETGEYPVIHKRGRKTREISTVLRMTIISVKKEFGLGSAAVAGYLREKRGTTIGIYHRNAKNGVL